MEDESAWVFDSLICFLNGPEWNAPLQSFIEEKSLIFEANAPDNEEHSKVYEEFKNLVDFMLGNFMEDLGITPQQFEDACNRQNTERIPIPFDQNLFELIWAANDYVMFKRMMCQKNVELQLQALELIERKYGITPQSFVPHDGKDTKTEKNVSFKDSAKTPVIEDKIMAEVVKNFPEPVPSSSNMEDVQYILKEKNALTNTLKEIESRNGSETNEKKLGAIPKGGAIPKVAEEKKVSTASEGAAKPKVDFMEKLPLNAEVDQLELKKRQEYLRAQRDKLVALKKDIRKKHLTVDQDPSEKLKKRPKSAKAAEDLLTGTKTHIEPQQLELRKTLIERLKSEVVQNKYEN